MNWVTGQGLCLASRRKLRPSLKLHSSSGHKLTTHWNVNKRGSFLGLLPRVWPIPSLFASATKADFCQSWMPEKQIHFFGCVCVCMCMVKCSHLTRIHLAKQFSLLMQIPGGFDHSSQWFSCGLLSGSSKYTTYVLKRSRSKQLWIVVWKLSQSLRCFLFGLWALNPDIKIFGPLLKEFCLPVPPINSIACHQFLSTAEEMGLRDSDSSLAIFITF